jgi:hypothetical protein
LRCRSIDTMGAVKRQYDAPCAVQPETVQSTTMTTIRHGYGGSTAIYVANSIGYGHYEAGLSTKERVPLDRARNSAHAEFVLRRLVMGAMLLAAPLEGWARPTYVDQIPHRPDGCGTCHVSFGGGGRRNSFGRDIEAIGPRGRVNWGAAAVRDSDEDGYTNGEELGDPDGLWLPGEPPPNDFAGAISAPGRPESTPLSPGVTGADYASGCRGVHPESTLLVLLTGLLVVSRRRRPLGGGVDQEPL